MSRYPPCGDIEGTCCKDGSKPCLAFLIGVVKGRIKMLLMELCTAPYQNCCMGRPKSLLCYYPYVYTQGDSGGPLACQVGNKWKLVGVASWVSSLTCDPGHPNVYTRISSFHSWIKDVIEVYWMEGWICADTVSSGSLNIILLLSVWFILQCLE